MGRLIILSPFRSVCTCVDEYQHYVELFLNAICLNKNCFIGAVLTKERDSDEQMSPWVFLKVVFSHALWFMSQLLPSHITACYICLTLSNPK